MIRHKVVLGLLVVMALTLVGCGGSGADVKLVKAGGVVTFQGKPLGDATVTFVPEHGPIALGMADKEGKFTLSTGTKPGVIVGKCRVSVALYAASSLEDEFKGLSESERNEKLTLKMGETPGEFSKDKEPTILPAKFGDASTSGLEFMVTDNPDKNVFEVKL